MARPGDVHWDLLRSRSEDVVRAVLDAVQAAGRPCILGGGWAVFAHVPSVPSVDCDVYADPAARQTLQGPLEARGLAVGSGREVELLPLESPQELLGTGDPDLQIPSAAYVPERLFQGRVVRAVLRLGDASLPVRVPAPAALLVVKLCAFRDRALAYRALEDGRALALLGPSVATVVRSFPQSYFLRKAAKDLADCGLLLGAFAAAGPEARGLAAEHGVWNAVVDGCREPPDAVLDVARDVADRVDFPDPWLAVRELFR